MVRALAKMVKYPGAGGTSMTEVIWIIPWVAQMGCLVVTAVGQGES